MLINKDLDRQYVVQLPLQFIIFGPGFYKNILLETHGGYFLPELTMDKTDILICVSGEGTFKHNIFI